MTNFKASATQGVNRPSQFAGNAPSVRLQFVMDEAHRLQIAARIADLRERSPLTQPKIAERLGIGLRAYQKLEEKGTTKWERVEELAEIHGVTPHYIWDGTEQGPTPDVLAELNGAGDLAALRESVDQLRGELLAAVHEASDEIERLRLRLEGGEFGQAASGR